MADMTYGQRRGSMMAGAAACVKLPWMAIPEPTNLCPPGLEYLTAVDHMLVIRQLDLSDTQLHVVAANKYQIVNSNNQQVYFATEESDPFQKMFCAHTRGFTMKIWDNSRNEVLRLVRPYQCFAGWTMCADKANCALTMEVEAPPGTIVGRVKQTRAFLEGHFDILSPDDEVLLKIRGPKCVCCRENAGFQIFSPEQDEEVGRISKKPIGFFEDYLTMSAGFCISFPMDLDVKQKATLFGALFLIDFKYFEDTNF